MSVLVSVEEQDVRCQQAQDGVSDRDGPNQLSKRSPDLPPQLQAASESDMFLHTVLSSLEFQASSLDSPTRSDRGGVNHADKCVLPHVYP